MKFTYRIVERTSSFLAECIEAEAIGEGKTRAEAIEALRAAIEERMFRPDAVAPPPRAPSSKIELELIETSSS